MENKKQNKKKLVSIFITVAIIVAIGILFFLFQNASSPEYKANYVCPVNETNEITINKPELINQIGRDTRYLAREDGSFVPKIETISQTTDGHVYSLNLESDKQYINPYPGDRIKFTVSLLEDGKKVRTMPTDEDGKPIFKYIQVFVGSNEPRRMWIDNLYSNVNAFLRGYYVQSGHSSFINYKNAKLETITAEQGQTVRSGSLNLSEGQTEFEYVWINEFQSFGEAPYLDFQIRAGNRLSTGGVSDNKGISTNQILCFIDMFTSDFEPTKINIQIKEDFYYEVNTKPTNLTVGEKEILKINITSRNTKNNRINKNPLQRIVILPLFTSGINNTDNFIGAVGGFDNKNIGQKIIDESIKHAFDVSKNTSRTIITDNLIGNPTQEIPNFGAAIDLINGQGSVYFAFNGKHVLPGFKDTSPYLHFIVYPTNYASSFRGKGGVAIPTSTDTQPYRIEKSIEIPAKPNDGKKYNFLYEKWYERESYDTNEIHLNLSRVNPLINDAHTIISVPIDNPDLFGKSANTIPNHLKWLLTLNLTLVALGGFMIWHYKNREDEDK